MRIAPSRPDRQWCITNDIGDVQCVRQTSFVRVTCQRPAATSVAEEAMARTFVIDPMTPRAITASNAATPKAPHVRKYGRTKRAVAALSVCFVIIPPPPRVTLFPYTTLPVYRPPPEDPAPDPAQETARRRVAALRERPAARAEPAPPPAAPDPDPEP